MKEVIVQNWHMCYSQLTEKINELITAGNIPGILCLANDIQDHSDRTQPQPTEVITFFDCGFKRYKEVEAPLRLVYDLTNSEREQLLQIIDNNLMSVLDGIKTETEAEIRKLLRELRGIPYMNWPTSTMKSRLEYEALERLVTVLIREKEAEKLKSIANNEYSFGKELSTKAATHVLELFGKQANNEAIFSMTEFRYPDSVRRAAEEMAIAIIANEKDIELLLRLTQMESAVLTEAAALRALDISNSYEVRKALLFNENLDAHTEILERALNDLTVSERIRLLTECASGFISNPVTSQEASVIWFALKHGNELSNGERNVLELIIKNAEKVWDSKHPESVVMELKCIRNLKASLSEKTLAGSFPEPSQAFLRGPTTKTKGAGVKIGN